MQGRSDEFYEIAAYKDYTLAIKYYPLKTDFCQVTKRRWQRETGHALWWVQVKHYR